MWTWYGDNVGNPIEDNSSVTSLIQSASCLQQGHVDSKALLQQKPPVLNLGAR